MVLVVALWWCAFAAVANNAESFCCFGLGHRRDIRLGAVVALLVLAMPPNQAFKRTGYARRLT